MFERGGIWVSRPGWILFSGIGQGHIVGFMRMNLSLTFNTWLRSDRLRHHNL